MKIYTGSPAGPVTVVGTHQTRLAQFALRFPGWHSHAKDRATVKALQGLAKRGIVEVSKETGQFRWMDTRPAQDNKPSELEVMARHYIIAALWADCEDGTKPRATKQALETAREDCAAFLAHIGETRLQAIRDAFRNGYGAHPDCGNAHPWMAALGHDFWLTRQGHGANFRDRDALPEDLREWLYNACGWETAFPEVYPEFYRGWLYMR